MCYINLTGLNIKFTNLLIKIRFDLFPYYYSSKKIAGAAVVLIAAVLVAAAVVVAQQ